MAEQAAELDDSEFDVVFNAAHMLRLAKMLECEKTASKQGLECQNAARISNKILYLHILRPCCFTIRVFFFYCILIGTF